jgi:hypothetical protein
MTESVKEQVRRYREGRAAAFDEGATQDLLTDEQRAAWTGRVREWAGPGPVDALDVGCGSGLDAARPATRAGRVGPSGIRPPAGLGLVGRAARALWTAAVRVAGARPRPGRLPVAPDQRGDRAPGAVFAEPTESARTQLARRAAPRDLIG